LHPDLRYNKREKSTLIKKVNKSTLRIIIILISLLFINIEAAQAGLIHRLRLYIRTEFSETQLVYWTVFVLLLSSLLYIIFSPLPIGHEKWSWFHYYTYNPKKNKFQRKRETVARISRLLKSSF
jgi:hypothetical protein